MIRLSILASACQPVASAGSVNCVGLSCRREAAFRVSGELPMDEPQSAEQFACARIAIDLTAP